MDQDAPSGTTPGFRVRERKRRRFPWIALAVLAVIVGAATLLPRLIPDRVVATAVQRRDVARTLVLTGRVRPLARPRIGSSLPGTVREVLVRAGQRIQRDELLVRLDDAPQRAALAQARAALAAAEGTATANLEVARLAAESAQRDAGRARALHAQGAISQRELGEAERLAANAVAAWEAARAGTGGTDPAALAEVARARAGVAAAEAQLALTRVRAPAAAIVLSRDVEPGDAVGAGQQLLELSLDGALELTAFAREENLAELAIGAAARASADAFPDSAFDARLAWLSPTVDPAQGTVEIRFSVPDPPRYLRPDMTISINVEVERRRGVLVVPRGAVGDIDGGEPWLMVERAGRAARQPVTLGVRGDRDVEVLDGLRESDRVLPVGTRPGDRVRVAVP